jgi:hypothetical protein
MSRLRSMLCLAVAFAGARSARATDEWLDRLGDALTVSALQDQFRAKLSGVFDLEGYDFSQPAPALLHAAGHDLFAPRLALFLDAQLGAHAYFFAQTRVDRGFDPANVDLRARVDEYALRLTPWSDGRFSVQVGKFATVVGNWTQRHGSWSNPFITAPLPYETLTGVWDLEAVKNATQLLQWSHVRPGLPAFVTATEKFRRLPIIWGPSYTMGAAVSGVVGRFNYALELKHAPLSSRPESWNRPNGHWQYPTVSGRLGWRPNVMWTLGASASVGSYLRPFAAASVPAGYGFGDQRQIVLAQDASFAWHHLQLWTEIYGSRFEIPAVGHADTLAYYAEAKYKFTPQWFGALRFNQQLYNKVPERGVPALWGQETWRLDLASGYRFTPHLQLKVQYNLQHGAVQPRDYAHLVATQLTLRF